MLNVSDATKSAYINGSLKTLTINVPGASVVFTNDDIVSESANLIEGIENGKNLTFKGCIATQFKFQVADIVRDLRGEYIEVTIRAGTTEEIPYFKGYIDTQDNQTHEDVLTTFTAYDVLATKGGINCQSFLESLTYPINVKNFRNALFTFLSIGQASASLINDNLQITSNILNYYENPKAVDLMRHICELNAVYGQIGRDGLFYYRELKPISEGTYPGEDTYPGSDTYPADENAGITIDEPMFSALEYEPYEVEKITKVAIYDSAGIDQGQAGSGTNVWSISDNPLAFSVNMRQAAANLLSKVDGLAYSAVIKLDCVGMPWVECGDTYMSYTRRHAVRTYVLNRTLKGIQALFDAYSSDSDRLMPPYKQTAISSINANRKTVLEIQADIVQMNELIAKKATIEQLNATNARVDTLSAKEANFENVTAQNFTAVSGNINTLSARVATVEQLDAQKATIAQLNATNANVSSLNAQVANLNTVVANKIDAQTVRANYMEIANWTSAGVIKADRLDANTIAAKVGMANRVQIVNYFGIAASASFTFKNYGVKWGTVNGTYCLVRDS